MKLKQLSSLMVCLFLAFTLSVPAATAIEASPSPPIAKGKMKTVSYVYFGKSEMFPVIGLLGINQEIDIYEYDKEWVLTKYDTYATFDGHTYGHAFYGYVRRDAVLCDPPLEGDQSPKADTGPGKRKGKKPRKPGTPSSPLPGDTASPKPEDSQKPEPTQDSAEDLMEYDWIIRTPGVCQVTLDMGGGAKYVCRFALYAMKFGGYTASSSPTFNDGKSNPYVGYLTYSMIQNTQDYLSENNLGFLKGSGGVSIEAFNNHARFTLDSMNDDGTNTILSIMTNMTSVLNPKITDDVMGIEVGGEMFRDNRVAPLDIKLVSGGSGYQLKVLNMKPGGGDLTFPAMLEKFPLDDITKAERERLEKEHREEEQRRKAKEEQDRALDEWRKKSNEGMEDKLNEDSSEGEEDEIELAPLSPDSEEIELAPLEPAKEGDDGDIGPGDDQVELAPLEPAKQTDSGDIGPGDDQVELAPLTAGGTPEEPDFFPQSKGQ